MPRNGRVSRPAGAGLVSRFASLVQRVEGLAARHGVDNALVATAAEHAVRGINENVCGLLTSTSRCTSQRTRFAQRFASHQSCLVFACSR